MASFTKITSHAVVISAENIDSVVGGAAPSPLK
jgi:hypothetical protein